MFEIFHSNTISIRNDGTLPCIPCTWWLWDIAIYESHIYQLRILIAVILAVEKARWPKRKPSFSGFYRELTDQSPDGLIARMIEQCDADPTVMGASPIQPWIFAKVAISTTVIALTWSRWVMSRNAGNGCHCVVFVAANCSSLTFI